MPTDQRSANKLLDDWRSANWPPKKMLKQGDLPIWIGDHEQVQRMAESLARVMAQLSEHISDHGGRVPRWMQVPKIEYLVERVNLVATKANASRRFTSQAELEAHCGPVLEQASSKLQEWLSRPAEHEVVAHKPFVDLRAYVFVRGSKQPRRHRFYQSGLILAAPTGAELVLQDNRKIIRSTRSDSFENPMATTAAGWNIYRAPNK